jgi:hypothetical protein
MTNRFRTTISSLGSNRFDTKGAGGKAALSPAQRVGVPISARMPRRTHSMPAKPSQTLALRVCPACPVFCVRSWGEGHGIRPPPRRKPLNIGTEKGTERGTEPPQI